MAQHDPARYLYPPRARMVLPYDDQAGIQALTRQGYTAQYKLNDSRLLLKLLPDRIELWNRHGDRFRDYTAPHWLQTQIRHAQDLLSLPRDGYHLLDGGLLDKKHAHGPKDTIALWDILVRHGEHLKYTTYQSRHDTLLAATGAPYTYPKGTTVGAHLTDHIFVPTNHAPHTWDTCWANLLAENAPYDQPLLEGLVFKDPNGPLGPGRTEQNNGDWMVRSRVTTRRHQF